LIPVLALLSNYDRENCLINVGTEGTVAVRKGPLSVVRGSVLASGVIQLIEIMKQL
jgi:hypothetical protein